MLIQHGACHRLKRLLAPLAGRAVFLQQVSPHPSCFSQGVPWQALWQAAECHVKALLLPWGGLPNTHFSLKFLPAFKEEGVQKQLAELALGVCTAEAAAKECYHQA